ncbi:MAG: undecaprenyl-diphosphate phosphatase [Desulfobulbaceae bacterium]|jgi:undecaprenyl-diphosphatase|nr:undecaprenyl-diphosphate phosphatase [Desulfobulbaceae bacterium]
MSIRGFVLFLSLTAALFTATFSASAVTVNEAREAARPKQSAPPPPIHVGDDSAMTITQAAILGLVEGLTEYLPVSSTGHLLLAEKLMGLDADAGLSADEAARRKDAIEAYIICIQAGAIIAVLGLYFRRVRQMGAGLTKKDPQGRRLIVNILAGFVPAAVIGLLCGKYIKMWLFGSWPVVAAWFVGGVLILLVHYRQAGRRRAGLDLEAMTWKMALIVGLMQCVAMWPGVSRSLVTIVGGLLSGLSLSAAVEFSFLLGLITLGAATAYDALKHGQEMLSMFSPAALMTGVLFAFVSAVAAVRWMVAYLNKHSMAIFGYYRVILALVVGGLLLCGAMN